MATEIKLIAQPRDGTGTPKIFDYKPGAKHAAESSNFYKVLVDGNSELPPGTKIVRKGNSVVFNFPDGSNFEIDNWCGITDSRLTDLGSAEAYSADQGAYVGAKEIDSGACVIWGDGGQAAAMLGDGGSAPAAVATASAGENDHVVPYILAGLLAAGAIGAASHGGGGGGGSSSNPGALPDALNEDFSPVSINATTLKLGSSSPITLEVISAKIKSADGFDVVVDNNPANDGSNDVQIVLVDGVPTLQLNGSGANKFGSIVTTVELQDSIGNVTTKDVTFIVNPVNDAPVNHVPPDPIIDPQDDFTIDATNLLILSVSDVDEATGPDDHRIERVNLTVSDASLTPGTINLDASGTNVLITNGGTTSVTLTGTEAELNTVLATIVYTSDGTITPRQVTMTMTTTNKDNVTLDTDDILINMSGLGGSSVGGGGGSVGFTELFSSDPMPTSASRAAPANVSLSSLIGDLHEATLQTG
jgi:hypothetical protein